VAILDAGRLLHLLAQRRNLIAWKIKDNSPQGYRIVSPEQFRQQFYRPDLSAICSPNSTWQRLWRRPTRRAAAAVQAKDHRQCLAPVVLITKPDMDGDTDKEMIAIEAIAVSVGDHPVTRMRLLIDGRPYQGNLSTFTIPSPKRGKVKRICESISNRVSTLCR